ncbi:MAG: ammonium transporter, partial [Rhodobacteraceae bacterium]|nr:ammonium transporter [Paracoccaceae bacterium]
PHSLTMTMIDGSLLCFGWFGFNAGSNLEANGGAALAMINTFIATAAAILAWNIIEKMTRKHSSMLGAASGMVAGLVAITPACGTVGPIGAIFLGAAASLGCYFFVAVVKNKMGYDDSLDVFGVHGVGGIIGAIGTGFLSSTAFGGVGTLADTAAGQTWIQLQAVVITIVWSGVVSFILLKVVDMIMGLRVPTDDERQGLDLTSHGESAYNY